MLKIAIASLLFGASLQGFAEENNLSFEEVFAEEFAIYEQLGLGNAQIINQDFIMALKHYHKADSLNKSAPEFIPEIPIITSFGSVIAYDNLDMDDKCRQAIGSLFLACFADKSNIEPILLNDEGEHFKEVMALLKKMASLAKSANVREMLTQFVDGIMED